MAIVDSETVCFRLLIKSLIDPIRLWIAVYSLLLIFLEHCFL